MLVHFSMQGRAAMHMKVVETQNVWGKVKTVLLGREKAQRSPRWEGQAAGRRGPRFFTKFDLQAFIFMHVWTCRWSSRRIHEPPICQNLCGCPQRGQGWGAACHVTGVLYRTRPSDLRPHADCVQNSRQSANLHYWALILFSLIISSCFSLQY